MGPSHSDEQRIDASGEVQGEASRGGATKSAMNKPDVEAIVRKGSGTATPSGESAAGAAAGVQRSQRFRHHPIMGYEYCPGARVTHPRPGGGSFEFIVNSAGIRSNREYSFVKPAGVYRILVFGDSQAGGMYQSNEDRFSELMEARNPGLELINFSTPGTGTDQQLLAFEQIGCKYEYDLVILMPFLMNIRRNVAWTLPTLDPKTGRVVQCPKPRFELVTGGDGSEVLELANVPVPEVGPSSDAQPDPAAEQLARGIRHPGNRLSLYQVAKRAVVPLVGRLRCDPFPLLSRLGYDPLTEPEYRSPDTAEWRLMAAIIKRFAQGAAPKPFVIAPLVNSRYVRFSVGRSYWQRFSSLADGERVHVIDVLPHFLRLGRQAVRCFLEPHDAHLSNLGHSVLADTIEAELKRLGLFPMRNTTSGAVDKLETNSAVDGRNTMCP